MSRPLQLRIPTPCHENWENMHPNEKGRHCMACQKTVVDFTLMSDAEIIHYFSKASGSVCGRVGADQLNRKLVAPGPPRKSPWMGWPVLLSGLMFAADEMGSQRVVGKTELHQCERPKSDGMENLTLGTMAVMRPDTSTVEQVGERHDTTEVIMKGEMMGDVITVVEPPEDTARAGKRHEGRTVTRLSRNIFDTAKQIVADSLAIVGVRTSDPAGLADMKEEHVQIKSESFEIKEEPAEVTVYPNPVLRGGSLNLTWKKEVMNGRINLYNVGGALIQSWMIQGGSTMRTLMMPADITSGVYVLQVQTKDGVYNRKVVVE